MRKRSEKWTTTMRRSLATMTERGQPESETTANRGSSSKTCRTTTKCSETWTPAPKNGGHETATATATEYTKDTAGRKHNPK